MANLGNLSVNLQLQSAQFVAGLRQAAAASQASATAINSAMNMAKGAAVGFIGALSVDAFSNQIQQAFDYADAIQDLSDRTGAGTKFIQEFRYAAQLAGSSVESADAGLEKFSKTMGSAINGNKAAQETLAKYGVTSRDVDEAVRQAAQTISTYKDKSAQAAATAELFGKKNQNLTATMASGRDGLSDFAQKAQDLGIILDKDVISNAGQVNDKLDTMRMILTAQLAGTIVQNADALVALANGFMAAATAAANFFQQMDVKRLASVANGVNMNSDLGVLLQGRLQGKSMDETQADALKQLKMTSAGRSNRYKYLADSYNAEIRKGTSKDAPFMQAIRAEREDILKQEVSSRRGLRPPKPIVPTGTIPTPTAKSSPKSKSKGPLEHLLSGGELDERWKQAYFASERERRDSADNLSLNPADRFQSDRQRMADEYVLNTRHIGNETGTEDEVRKGKKRYTEAQAQLLRQAEKEIFDNNYDASMRDEAEQVRKDRLDVLQSSLRNDIDLMQAEASVARSSTDRRTVALRLVDKSYELERVQLEGIVASKTATQAEKDIATARLAILSRLKAGNVQQAKDQTQGPLESYLKSIPSTAGEINDDLERVQVEGLNKLEDGLMSVTDGTKSVKDAFADMANGIVQGLIKIAIQQAIIKPLGNLLFGGSEGSGGGGGLLGSILGSVLKGTIKGARANGGMTQPGDYLVGERGPEIARIGNPANVISNAGLRGVAGAANDNGGVHVSIGHITSNDPAAVKRMVFEGIAQAMPMNSEQASNAAIGKIKRRRM
jgi:hypothetical protein